MSDQDARNATGVANGLVNLAPSLAQSASAAAPTFVAGTNTLETTAQNVLQQTPFSSMNVSKQLAVASAEASKFLESGNIQNLNDGRLPNSTNPAPTAS